MKLIYQPRDPEATGAQGFFRGEQVIVFRPNVITHVDDVAWRDLERRPEVAKLLAEGLLRIA